LYRKTLGTVVSGVGEPEVRIVERPVHEVDLVLCFVAVPHDFHFLARFALLEIVITRDLQLRGIDTQIGLGHLRNAVCVNGVREQQNQQYYRDIPSHRRTSEVRVKLRRSTIKV